MAANECTLEVIGQQGLAIAVVSRDNDLVTITYPNGYRVRAMLLSRNADTLRVALEGDSDSREFYCTSGAWVSEDCEAVTIEFEWEQRPRQVVPSLADCICSPELAGRLMEQLVNPAGDSLEDMLYVLSAEGQKSGLPPQTVRFVN